MISNRGFSLVEVLISIVVVVLAGVGTLKLYSYIEVEKSNAMMAVEAKRVAENQISALQALNTLDSSCAGKTLDDINTCILTLPAGSPFTVTMNNVKAVDSPVAGGAAAEVYAKVIGVEVSWIDRNGENRSIELPATVSKFTNLLD